MAKKRPYTYPEEVENAYEELPEPTDVVQQEPIGELTPEDIVYAKQIKGTPASFNIPQGVVTKLLHYGIAVDVDDGKLMRGRNWRKSC